MILEIHRRYAVSPKQRIILYVIFLILGITIFVIIELTQGIAPTRVLSELFISPFTNPAQVLITLRYTIPIGLSALGLLLVYKAGIYSIGAEGQMAVGAVLTAWAALFLVPNYPPPIAIAISIIFGALGGALWGIIPGILKGLIGTNEIITTLMMNFIAYTIIDYLIYGPWRSPKAYNFPFTNPVPKNTQLLVIGDSRFSPMAFVIFIVMVIVSFIILNKTKLGFELRTFGANPKAAYASGMSFAKVVILGMFLSGMLAGIAGSIQLLAVHHYLGPKPWNVTEGLGYTAILAAWLAGLNPLAVLPTAFLLGGLVNGSFNLRAALNQPAGIVDLMTSTLLLSIISAEFFLNYSIKLRIPRGVSRGVK
ncbi:MAG: hypothetical protein DRO15_07190 [Thermoprotei archaeon]|nr:MAG: hypothetical protein DRO15_07190 [Thermoprotei archaeon]